MRETAPTARVTRTDRPGVGQAWRFIVLFVLALVALYEFLNSSWFRVQEIHVEGCRSLSTALVVQESGIVLGENIWRVDLDRAAASIEADPWVANAQVTRKLPGSIIITIQERTPLAAVAYHNVYLLVARDGLVLATVPEVDGLGLAVLQGFAIQPAWVQSQLKSQEILNVLDSLAMLDTEWQSYIARIVLGQDGQLQLITQAGYPVDLGPADRELPTKFEALAAVWTDLKTQGKAGSVAEINLEASTRPTVRFQPAGGG